VRPVERQLRPAATGASRPIGDSRYLELVATKPPPTGSPAPLLLSSPRAKLIQELRKFVDTGSQRIQASFTSERERCAQLLDVLKLSGGRLVGVKDLLWKSILLERQEEFAHDALIASCCSDELVLSNPSKMFPAV